jgi:hypothetical protein
LAHSSHFTIDRVRVRWDQRVERWRWSWRNDGFGLWLCRCLAFLLSGGCGCQESGEEQQQSGRCRAWDYVHCSAFGSGNHRLIQNVAIVTANTITSFGPSFPRFWVVLFSPHNSAYRCVSALNKLFAHIYRRGAAVRRDTQTRNSK